MTDDGKSLGSVPDEEGNIANQPSSGYPGTLQNEPDIMEELTGRVRTEATNDKAESTVIPSSSLKMRSEAAMAVLQDAEFFTEVPNDGKRRGAYREGNGNADIEAAGDGNARLPPDQ